MILYFRKLRVHLVVDHTDTVSAKSLTTPTRAEIVVDYADKMSAYSMTTPTLSENFEGFSLTDFKGTIRGKKALGFVYTPNSNNLKI